MYSLAGVAQAHWYFPFGPAKDEVFDGGSFCKKSVKNQKVLIPCDLPSDKLT